MNVILYMATTANGLIAKEDNDTSFTSKEDWDSFKTIAKEVGNIIMGSKTYESFDPQEFPIPGTLNVVLSGNTTLKSPSENVVFLNESPDKVVDFLEAKGFKSALVVGGGFTNAEFMKGRLIDEIYLDIEPIILSQGVPLLRPVAPFEFKLELLEVKNLSPQTVQLHYKVLH